MRFTAFLALLSIGSALRLPATEAAPLNDFSELDAELDADTYALGKSAARAQLHELEQGQTGYVAQQTAKLNAKSGPAPKATAKVAAAPKELEQGDDGYVDQTIKKFGGGKKARAQIGEL